MFCLKVAASVISCCSVSVLSVASASNTAPNVTFTAAGTFANPQVSGSDELKMSGEPFSISIVANAAAVPIKHGPNWAVYSPLKMTGVVHSGLLGPIPVSIASGAASIELVVGPSYDLFITAFPVKVVGISLTINATITLPAGTLANQLIHPFTAVAITPTNATVTYSDGTNSTTLAIQSGSLGGTIPSTSARAVLQMGTAASGAWSEALAVHVQTSDRETPGVPLPSSSPD